MKSIAIGVHLRRDHIEPIAEALPVGDVFLSSLAVHEDQPMSDRELLIRVAGVRAQLVERGTFIAIRYGFSFRTPAEAAAKCAGKLEQWKSTLTEHDGRVELTLRVAASGPTRPQRSDFSDGAEYLRALHAATRGTAVTGEFRSAVDDLIVPLCVAHRWMPRDEKSMELAGLIERARLAMVDDAGRALKERCPSVPFLLSAPWPLEVFADADRE
jgi:hypothetical protein